MNGSGGTGNVVLFIYEILNATDEFYLDLRKFFSITYGKAKHLQIPRAPMAFPSVIEQNWGVPN
jgi:hypothetical protein